MPKITIADGPRCSTCRLCSQPITNGNCGWYHDARNLGTIHGIRPRFAEPATSVA